MRCRSSRLTGILFFVLPLSATALLAVAVPTAIFFTAAITASSWLLARVKFAAMLLGTYNAEL